MSKFMSISQFPIHRKFFLYKTNYEKTLNNKYKNFRQHKFQYLIFSLFYTKKTPKNIPAFLTNMTFKMEIFTTNTYIMILSFLI